MPAQSTQAPQPQPVLSPLTEAAVFLVLTIDPGGEDAVRELLGDVVQVVDEVQGFRYFDERDLTGFVDGTESPQGPASVSAAIVDSAADQAFAGGSYVIVQKYLHDLTAWNALSVEEQERVIGRTKLADIELPDAADLLENLPDPVRAAAPSATSAADGSLGIGSLKG